MAISAGIYSGGGGGGFLDENVSKKTPSTVFRYYFKGEHTQLQGRDIQKGPPKTKDLELGGILDQDVIHYDTWLRKHS